MGVDFRVDDFRVYLRVYLRVDFEIDLGPSLLGLIEIMNNNGCHKALLKLSQEKMIIGNPRIAHWNNHWTIGIEG